MLYSYFAILLTFWTPIQVESNQYDFIVIPIPKVTSKLKKFTNYDGETLPRIKNRKELYRNGESLYKLDIEDYDESTNVPDVDNFDYKTNREAYPRQSDHDRYDMEMNYGDDKIVGGVEADIDSHPYHVAYGTNCGGAIIDKKWVISAGHCGTKAYIRVGSKYLNQGKKVTVKRNIVHPSWSAKNKDHPFDYDFQLLELAEPLVFDEYVQPVKIAHIQDMVIGKLVTVTGWGNTEENGPYSATLRAVRVPIISKDQCQSVPFPYFRGSLTPRMFCAGYPEGQKDACQGDSGGPAVSNERLMGMVSFGYGCATPGSYGVYSKVAKVRSWIEETTGLILNGHDISISDAAYQINYGDICGGVLIHQQWALTAAHCGTEMTFIRIGSKYRLNGPKISVLRHLVHPMYGDMHDFDYDVQLLEVQRRLHLSERVGMIPISDGECGDNVVVTGWGYAVERGQYKDILQRVKIPVVPIEECQGVNEFWYNHTLTPRMFCAGGSDGDACQGDSGGAAVSYGKLVGLSSFGFGCGRDVPGVYTNLSDPQIIEWIRKYAPV